MRGPRRTHSGSQGIGADMGNTAQSQGASMGDAVNVPSPATAPEDAWFEATMHLAQDERVPASQQSD
eukprot:12405315-Karenia_brevis.AAC.1